ncbi:hypothetical protein MRX96_019602 [Rhipicephalus microplus]
MCAVPREDDRRLVFDPRWRRSYSASMGSKPAESSRPSFVFIQALYEKGSARAVERTTKEMLFEGFSVFGAAGGASKASTRPVLEQRPRSGWRHDEGTAPACRQVSLRGPRLHGRG